MPKQNKKWTYNRFPSGRHLLKIQNEIEKEYQQIESRNPK
jgi:hypothetical protein